MEIAVGSDHAGYAYKTILIEFLINQGYKVYDCGTFSDESTDYPDYAHAVALKVKQGNLGVVICGSGNGVNMTVNKHKGIRSALCWTEEIARLARAHNNANILAIPARFVTEEVMFGMMRAFLDTPFEGGRHQNRVNKIDCI